MKTVSCPHCAKPTPFDPSNRWRPFCSERCRTIDLGAWASESYRVPLEEAPETNEDPGASAKPPES